MMSFPLINTYFAAFACLAVLASLAILTAYRLFFHPLAGYPGPLLARLTNWYAVYHAYRADVHLDMLRCHQKYGPVVRYGPNKIIFNQVSAIKHIYSRSANVQKATSYLAFRASPTAHDLQSTVDKVEHDRKRRVISQAFSDSALRTLEQYVIPHTDKLVGRLSSNDAKSNADGEWTPVKNIADWCTYVSFDYMTELVFGKALHLLSEPTHHYFLKLIDYATRRTGILLQMPSLVAWNLDRYLAPQFQARRKQYHETAVKMSVERMEAQTSRQDVFHHILKARDPETGQGFSMDEIWGEANLLIIAGSDALSIAMAACFFYLSRHGQAYERVKDEVRTTFGSNDDIRHGSILDSCIYLHACIDESMRMSPSVGGALWREVCHGGTVIDGHNLPAGCDVGIGIYAIHHNPEYYPDPFTFKPERWLSDSEKSNKQLGLARSAFQTFSTGPTGCVGKNLAYMELKLTLARVCFNLDFKLTEERPKKRTSDEAYLRSYKEHDEHEYHLRDRFTSWKDGPMLSFRKR